MALNNLYQNQQPQGGIDQLAQNAMFPQSQMDKTQYAVPSQMPTSAEVINSDYDPQTDPYTGMPAKPFAAGGIASIPRYSGADGSDVQAPAPWDPASGQVTLQQLDPTGQADPKSVAYTIPKDSIKTFVANTNDNGQEDPSLGGKYILNDGSTMIVGGDGTVTAATPARNEYTLNKDGYYQPTGSDLTWNGQANLLTKNIGGVDVQVPGMYTKGGYQDAQGNLRTDANGVPVALAPNYLDSGFGQSGLADAAPYIAAAAMAAMTMGASAPESATMLAPEATGDVFAGYSATGSAAGTAGSTVPADYGAASSAIPDWATQNADAAAQEAAQTAPYNTAPADIAAAGKGMTAAQAAAAKMGLDMLTGGTKGSQATASGGGSSTAPQQITPDINRGGVTGYQGEAVSPNGNITPAQLSGIKGVGQPQYFAQGGIANLGSYSDGGKTEDKNMIENLTEKEKDLLRPELMAQSLKPMPGSEYLGSSYVPQGAFGRVGASTDLDETSKLRAGLSGMAMAAPGQHGVKTMPGSMDIGYNTQVGPGNLDLSAFRSINPVPEKGHMQGLNARYTVPFAQGGNVDYNLGSYSDGGQLLRGPGDGMSDNIPAKIGNSQPARLADGEFVIPADVVSHLGNGSTDAGAKQLYVMMEKIRKARTGNKKQGKRINPSKFLL